MAWVELLEEPQQIAVRPGRQIRVRLVVARHAQRRQPARATGLSSLTRPAGADVVRGDVVRGAAPAAAVFDHARQSAPSTALVGAALVPASSAGSTGTPGSRFPAVDARNSQRAHLARTRPKPMAMTNRPSLKLAVRMVTCAPRSGLRGGSGCSECRHPRGYMRGPTGLGRDCTTPSGGVMQPGRIDG
jgi:hypothetical protein